MAFRDNDEKVKYFTGFSSYAKLVLLLKYLKDHFVSSSSVTSFQQFLLALIKMRMGLTNVFLSYLFKVSSSTVSRIFANVLDTIYKEYNKDEFVCKLQKINWNSVLNNTNVNNAWYSFSQMFKNVIDEVAPLKEVRLKQRNQVWFNREVREMIRLRNQAYSKFKQSKNNDDYLEFKKIRNLTQRKIQICKRDYILNQLDENKGCSKKLWHNLK